MCRTAPYYPVIDIKVTVVSVIRPTHNNAYPFEFCTGP